jgi:hypothetical protein
MKLFVKKSGGISTVVGTALMLSAVAILGSTIVMWSNSNLGSYETKLASTSTSNANKFNEYLSIENVWFCKNSCPHGITAPATNLTLTNVGSVGLNVTQIKLSSTSSAQTFSVTNGGITPARSYMWEQTYTWQSKVPITISATTARGTIFTTQVTPP